MDKHKIHLGCCMVILNPAGDKVLVAKRKKEPDMGGLQIPGGTVDYENGELPLGAVVREAEEETGLIIKQADFLCLVNSFYCGAERPIHLGFVGQVESEDIPANPEPHKAEDWHWVSLADLPADKWFRMSRVTVDFYNALQADPNLSRYVTDEEYSGLREELNKKAPLSQGSPER